jgi:hypothetical protein
MAVVTWLGADTGFYGRSAAGPPSSALLDSLASLVEIEDNTLGYMFILVDIK